MNPNRQNMPKVILVDFAYTLCFPKTNAPSESLNGLYHDIKEEDDQANPLNSLVMNQELLNYLRTLKTNYKIYIFTSGTMHTDQRIQQFLEPVFNGYFTSIQLNMPKSFPNAYKVIANKLSVTVADIIFIDDQQKNIQAAITAGCTGVLFTNTARTIESIQKIIQKN